MLEKGTDCWVRDIKPDERVTAENLYLLAVFLSPSLALIYLPETAYCLIRVSACVREVLLICQDSDLRCLNPDSHSNNHVFWPFAFLLRMCGLNKLPYPVCERT